MHTRLSALLVSSLVVAAMPSPALSQAAPPNPPEWMWGQGYGWQFWWICPLMMLFMIVVLAVIFFIVRRSGVDGSHRWEPPWRGPGHSALRILSERFARGEIERDEYEERKAAILSGGRG